MKKSKFIKSTVILLLGGLITKLLGMVIRIVMSRNLGSVVTVSYTHLTQPTTERV